MKDPVLSTQTSSPIRVAIAGQGRSGYNIHARCIRSMPDRFQVVAAADQLPERQREAADEFGARACDHWQALIHDGDYDLFVNALPSNLHVQATIAALNAGKHVLCEKPMAMNAREGQQMVNAAEAAGKQLQISLNFRFRPEVQFCKRVIEEGAIGTPYYGRSQSIRRRGVPSWGVFGQKKLQGGGPLIDIGVHCIDWTWYLMGCPRPVAVSGQTYETIGATPGHIGQFGVWDHKTYDVEDFATALVRFENGATMNVESAFCVNLDKNQMGCHVAGDKGGVSTDPVTVQTSIAGHLVDGTPNHLQGGKLKTHWLSVEGFVKAIAAGKEVPIPASQVLWVQKIIDAIYKSAERGKEVAIK